MREKLFGLFLIVIPILFLISIPLSAHHGAASFDTTKEIVLKGTVTEWIWANPHCFLKFEVKDESGATKAWAAEVSNPTDMTRRGWARTSFKTGEEVTVTLQPSRNGAPVGRIRTVVLANGQTFSAMGAAPTAPTQPK